VEELAIFNFFQLNPIPDVRAGSLDRTGREFQHAGGVAHPARKPPGSERGLGDDDS